VERLSSLSKLVSGGQTGVDRGALDAALAQDFSCGGWCPPGRAAEDGPIPPAYPLTEMSRGGYLELTVQNVIDSDATLVLYFSEIHGGTAQTVVHCVRRRKPLKLIDAEVLAPDRAALLAHEFTERHQVSVLNVAGPRGSDAPLGYSYSYDVVLGLISRVRARPLTGAR